LLPRNGSGDLGLARHQPELRAGRRGVLAARLRDQGALDRRDRRDPHPTGGARECRRRRPGPPRGEGSARRSPLGRQSTPRCTPMSATIRAARRQGGQAALAAAGRMTPELRNPSFACHKPNESNRPFRTFASSSGRARRCHFAVIAAGDRDRSIGWIPVIW